LQKGAPVRFGRISIRIICIIRQPFFGWETRELPLAVSRVLKYFGFMIRSLAPALACLLCAPTVAPAQSNAQTRTARPNFSGTWKLNLQRSGPIMPRGLEALTMVIDHREPSITSRETRVVSGKTTSSKDGTATIDDIEHAWHPEPGITEKQRQSWSGTALIKHWEKTVEGTTYISDIRQTLSEDGKVLIMSEHYREPGMQRIRDWVFEKQ
jgi:hypothetical protein